MQMALPLPPVLAPACSASSDGSPRTQSTLASASISPRSSAASPRSSQWSPIASEREQVPPLPCLLRERLFAAVPMPAFKVKNTFIDDLAGEGEDEASTPSMGRRKTAPAKVLDDGATEELESERAAVEIEPLPVRQTSVSLGAVAHGTGLCKPCGWYWRPQGCENGADCRHCHLCDAAAVRSRKKKALKANRAAKLQRITQKREQF